MRTRPRSLALLLLVGLAGCGGSAGEGAGQAGPVGVLTGLYESGEGPRRNQLCLIERDGGAPSFGLIIWGEGDRNCSGSGLVRRDGNRLQLLLDGDQSCAVDASLAGDTISLTSGLGAECARYYCGDGARIGGALVRSGGGAADSTRAVDLVGDRLCGS